MISKFVLVALGAVCLATTAHCGDIKIELQREVMQLNRRFPSALSDIRRRIGQGNPELEEVLETGLGEFTCTLERQRALQKAKKQISGEYGQFLSSINSQWCSAIQSNGGESDWDKQEPLVAKLARQHFESPPKALTRIEIESSNAILARKDEITADEAVQLLTDSSRPAFSNEVAVMLLKKVAAAQGEAEEKGDWDKVANYPLGSCGALVILAGTEPGSCNDIRMRLFAFHFNWFNSQRFPVARYAQEVAHNHYMECKKVGEFV